MKYRSFLILFPFVMAGCAAPDESVGTPLGNSSVLDVPTTNIAACPPDTLTCPDGSQVSRQLPDCEFESCPVTEETTKVFNTEELRSADEHFNFQASIPSHWEIEYVPESLAINFYSSGSASANQLEQSQVFVKFFTASNFLTLSTVDIHSREELKINDRMAVRYDIEKKGGVTDFPDQPSWRNKRHFVTDIRSTDDNPTTFYVFARRPDLDQNMFEDFLNSITFNPAAKASSDQQLRADEARGLYFPIEKFSERITKKPFGLFVSPQNSPVQPERFIGYHTGADLEIVTGEEDAEIPVYAIASGEVLVKKTASGYGGVVVIEHKIGELYYSTLYGHLNINSVGKSVGEKVTTGEKIGILGRGGSAETDGERKHLHFSLREGQSRELRGYVDQEKDLEAWLDPQKFFEKSG